MYYYEITKNQNAHPAEITNGKCFTIDTVVERLLIEQAPMQELVIKGFNCLFNFGSAQISQVLKDNDKLEVVEKATQETAFTVTKHEYEFLSEIDSIFRYIPVGKFKINRQMCSGFKIAKHCQFSMEEGVIILSHQQLLDAYLYEGKWHAAWEDGIHKTKLFFVFDFS